jgi:transketolase
VDNAWNHFKTTLLESVERNVPRFGTGTRLKNQWMMWEILRLIRRKWRKWKVAKLSRSAEDMIEYLQKEKETAKKILNAKRKLKSDLASGEDKNNRKFTKSINSKSKSRTTIGPLKDKNKELVPGDKEMANELNTFFDSVFRQEDLNVVSEPETETVRKKWSRCK